MDKFLLAANITGISDEIKQNNEDVKADFLRLLSIVDILVESMGSYIMTIYVTPINLMLRKFDSIENLKLTIVTNPYVVGEEEIELSKQCRELAEGLLSGEFPMVKKMSSPTYTKVVNIAENALVLYTVFPEVDVNSLDDNTFIWLYMIMQSGEYTLSVSSIFDMLSQKTLFIHCNGIDNVVKLRKDMINSKELYGISIKEYQENKTYKKEWCYVPVIGHKPLEYKIPLKYIDLSMINMQRIYTFLNPQES